MREITWVGCSRRLLTAMQSRERRCSTSRGEWRFLAIALVLVGACGDVSSEDKPDAPIPDAPIPDASTPPCSPTAAFGAPRLVPGADLNTAATESGPRLTADQLGLYFNRNPGSVGQWDIYLATRAQVGDDFGVPRPVAGINASTTNETSPTVTADGLTMYLDSSAGNGNLVVSTRANLSVDFSAPVPVSAVNTSDTDRAPYVLPEGRALYFSRFGTMTGPGEKIYRAAIGSAGIGAPVEVTGLEAVASRGLPVVTLDELTIYFATSGGATSDMWMARRTRPADPFGTPALLSELNEAGSSEEPGWISSDGCVLYFTSFRAGSGDLYVAERGQ